MGAAWVEVEAAAIWVERREAPRRLAWQWGRRRGGGGSVRLDLAAACPPLLLLLGSRAET